MTFLLLLRIFFALFRQLTVAVTMGLFSMMTYDKGWICTPDIRAKWYVPQTTGPPGHSRVLIQGKDSMGNTQYSTTVWLTEEVLHMKTLAISQTG